MSKGSIGLDEALNDYIQRVGVREHPVLARLRERTATMENAQMQISPDEGVFLEVLTRVSGARHAVEVGTFTGYSALCIARALATQPENWREYLKAELDRYAKIVKDANIKPE